MEGIDRGYVIVDIYIDDVGKALGIEKGVV